MHDHEAAMEEFASHLAGKLREIYVVEFTPEKTVGRHGRNLRSTTFTSRNIAGCAARQVMPRCRISNAEPDSL